MKYTKHYGGPGGGGASDPRSMDDLTAVVRLAALFLGRRGPYCQDLKPKVAFLFHKPVDVLPAAL